MFFKPRKQQPPAMTLEGILGPNSRLDDAAAMKVDRPDALCIGVDGRLLYSAGNSVFALGAWGDAPILWASFDRAVTALACSLAGRVAVGLSGGAVVIADASGQYLPDFGGNLDLRSVVDCLFLSEEELVLVDCGYAAEENVLSVAPWDDEGRGKVISVSRTGAIRILARDLHCPMGICQDAHGQLVISELERARLVDLSGRVMQAGYPAYLGRIRKAGTGYLLACLSRRDPLIEFLRTEEKFVAAMKSGIAPQHWISPRVSPEFSHDFPIELGATRLFGEIKPWAPSFSYGLMIALDSSLMPVTSAQSRANGARHAISDAVEWNGTVLAVSKASQEMINLGAKGFSQ